MLYTLLIPSPRCPSGVYVVCAGLSLFRVYVSVLVYACVIANYDMRWVEAKKHDGCVCVCVWDGWGDEISAFELIAYTKRGVFVMYTYRRDC